MRLSSSSLVLASLCVLNSCGGDGGGGGDPLDGEYECSFDGGPPLVADLDLMQIVSDHLVYPPLVCPLGPFLGQGQSTLPPARSMALIMVEGATST